MIIDRIGKWKDKHMMLYDSIFWWNIRRVISWGNVSRNAIQSL